VFDEAWPCSNIDHPISELEGELSSLQERLQRRRPSFLVARARN
jgi:hypothetical protein